MCFNNIHFRVEKTASSNVYECICLYFRIRIEKQAFFSNFYVCLVWVKYTRFEIACYGEYFYIQNFYGCVRISLWSIFIRVNIGCFLIQMQKNGNKMMNFVLVANVFSVEKQYFLHLTTCVFIEYAWYLKISREELLFHSKHNNT